MKRLGITALSLATMCALSADFKVIDKEVNSGKTQVYFKIELPRPKDASVIEGACRSLDTEAAKKFVVMVYLPGTGTTSAYATCSRMLGKKLELKVL
ncbi:MAG: hypothetical protein V4454_18190 [Pseudomonadota bacterium]